MAAGTMRRADRGLVLPRMKRYTNMPQGWLWSPAQYPFRSALLPAARRLAARLLASLLLAVLLLTALLMLQIPTANGATADGDNQELLQQLFPKATRIGAPLPDIPAIPVYQLNELIGYGFLTTELTDLPGFSGKPIELLVAIDTQGQFVGVKVITHHEPVFLHGLGPQPMLDFLAQYRGHRLNERIIVSSTAKKPNSPPGLSYFDGVSKATVSVVIINDTIVASALAVARKTLQGFTRRPPAVPRQDQYEPLNWQQLLERGYLRHWTLPLTKVASALPQPLEHYQQLDFSLEPSATGSNESAPPFTNLYFAYLNAPIIGRNLLGDAGFAELQRRLKPGEQALMVMSNGIYPHASDTFVPESVSQRLSVHQNQLPIELRDLNLALDLNPLLGLGGNNGRDNFDRFHLFRIKPHAGFDPSSPSELQLDVTLQRNHLIQDSASFRTDYSLPDVLFEHPQQVAEQTLAPVWVRLWQDKQGQIALLVIFLSIVLSGFVGQHWLSRQPWFYRYRGACLLTTLLFIGMYLQGQLSVVNIYTLLLSAWYGFDIRLFLMDPVIFILWVFTLVTTLVWGRGIFCGWLCPFGALQEIVAWLAARLHIRQWRVSEALHRRLLLIKYPLLLVLICSAFYSLTLAERLAEIEPFKTSITLTFQRAWPFVIYALALLGAGLFVHKFYCRYLCPLGAGLAVLGRIRRFNWLDRIELCGNPCQRCKRSCGINAIRVNGEIDYDECIQCLECIVILNDQGRCVDKLQQTKRQRGLLQPHKPLAIKALSHR